MGQVISKCFLIKRSTSTLHIDKEKATKIFDVDYRVTFMNSLFATRGKYFNDYGTVVTMIFCYILRLL